MITEINGKYHLAVETVGLTVPVLLSNESHGVRGRSSFGLQTQLRNLVQVYAKLKLIGSTIRLPV